MAEATNPSLTPAPFLSFPLLPAENTPTSRPRLLRLTLTVVLSPGIAISFPSPSVIDPVTSAVRM
jgi:hypothetical protein